MRCCTSGKAANQEIERNLSSDEIEKNIELIGGKINWYDAIAYSINEKLMEAL